MGNQQRTTNLINKKNGSKKPMAKSQPVSSNVSTFTKPAQWIVASVAFVVFAVLSYYFLIVCNSDYLYSVNEHNLWLNESFYFNEKMLEVGGFAQWLGCYFTQYFYYPQLGAFMLIAMWGVLYVLTMKALGISKKYSALALVPCVCLLVSVISLGYWLYYIKYHGYWFSQTISLIIMMAAVWAHRVITSIGEKENASLLQKSFGAIFIVAWTVAFYPLIGAWALVGALAMMISTIPSAVAGAVSVGLVPLLYYYNYTHMRLEDAWFANFPILQNGEIIGWSHVIPFIIIVAFVVLIKLFSFISKNFKLTENYMPLWAGAMLNIAFLALLVWYVKDSNYDYYNYHAELRMHRAVDESRWNDVLDEAAKAPGKMSRQMVISKNIALMNTGEIGNKMFHYDNSGEPPYAPDSLRVHMVQTAGTQIYYNYGKMNFACRWAIEDGVEFGFDVDDLKTLARTALFNGEDKVARKYLRILSKTTFWKDWADERMAMLNDKRKFEASQEYKDINPLRNFNNTLDGDQGLCEMYLIQYFSNMMNDDPKFQEQTIAFALIQKDIQLFWPRFFAYATMHENESMPIHYQEAAYLYGHLEHGVAIDKMPFNEERIVKRYEAFQNATQRLLRNGLSSPEVGEQVKSQFGDTFWWFYFFCRDVHSY